MKNEIHINKDDTTAKISLENAVGHLTMQDLVNQMARDDLSSCLLHGNTAHSWLS